MISTLSFLAFIAKCVYKAIMPPIFYMENTPFGSPTNSAAINQLLQQTPISASLISQLILDGSPLDSSSSSNTAATLPQSASLRSRILESSLRIFRAQSPRPALDFFQYQASCVAKFLATLSSAVTDDILDFYTLEYLYSLQDSANLSTSAGGSRTTGDHSSAPSHHVPAVPALTHSDALLKLNAHADPRKSTFPSVEPSALRQALAAYDNYSQFGILSILDIFQRSIITNDYT